MVAYAVYTEYQEERLDTSYMKFFINKDKAIKEANNQKEELQYSNEWELADEFDSDDLTDSDNAITFIHKIFRLEATVRIDTIEIKS